MPVRAALCLLLFATSARGAPFRLASIFGSGMVLQRDAPVRAWGWGRPGSTTYGALINTATNGSALAEGAADVSGLWQLRFAPQAAARGVYKLALTSSPLDEARCDAYQFFCSGASVELTGISMGDVLLGIGQSNMQVDVAFAFNSTLELSAANALGGTVKVFQVAAAATANDGPLDDFAMPPQIPWSPASNTSLPTFSATLWFSAKALLEARPPADADVPLGLIAAPWGGTAIKAHAPLSVNATCGHLYPFPYGSNGGDCGLDHAPCNASTLFNSLIAPIAGPAGFAVSAMVWFQGENDAQVLELAYYACELRELAASLRAAFASPAAHWTTVQLAPYTGGAALGPFREMQCATTWGAIANSSCAVIVDDGDVLSPIGTVHSRNKQLVGRRVAAGLAAALYGAASAERGPQYAGAALASAPGGLLSADVRFDPATLGGRALVYAPPAASQWSNSSRCPAELGIVRLQDCAWFYILASDARAYNATVTLGASGTTLHLGAQAPAGTLAVGTSYGYNAWPVVSYYNAAGWPMVPWNATA